MDRVGGKQMMEYTCRDHRDDDDAIGVAAALEQTGVGERNDKMGLDVDDGSVVVFQWYWRHQQCWW